MIANCAYMSSKGCPQVKLMKFNWLTKRLKKNSLGCGGDAGEVFIVARKIIGNGKITADGGDGNIGGRGGKVTIISEDNQFSGHISARGGKSLSKKTERWWERTLVQIIFLFGAVASIIGLIILFG